MITSPTNDLVKYVRSLYQCHIRRRERAFVIEGVRLVEEALLAGVQPSLVLVDESTLTRTARGRELLAKMQPWHPRSTTEQVLKVAAETVTPQGVLAVVPMPPSPRVDTAGALLLILDRVADPGNVGTMLRTAWASGIVRTVVGLEAVDFYNPKVVRSATGAHFHLQLANFAAWDDLREQLSGRRLIVTVAADGVSYDQVDWCGSAALVVGSEAHGVRPEVVQAADVLAHIPMRGAAESLNAAVAAGILLFEAARHVCVTD